MLEKIIENKVVHHAKSKRWLAYKFTSPSCRGVPDRMFISPDGNVLFIEFKRKGHLPTALQEKKIKELRDHKMKVVIVDNIEQGIALIDEFDAKIITGSEKAPNLEAYVYINNMIERENKFKRRVLIDRF
jgi:hypothetical protein